MAAQNIKDLCSARGHELEIDIGGLSFILASHVIYLKFQYTIVLLFLSIYLVGRSLSLLIRSRCGHLLFQSAVHFRCWTLLGPCVFLLLGALQLSRVTGRIKTLWQSVGYRRAWTMHQMKYVTINSIQFIWCTVTFSIGRCGQMAMHMVHS